MMIIGSIIYQLQGRSSSDKSCLMKPAGLVLGTCYRKKMMFAIKHWDSCTFSHSPILGPFFTGETPTTIHPPCQVSVFAEAPDAVHTATEKVASQSKQLLKAAAPYALASCRAKPLNRGMPLFVGGRSDLKTRVMVYPMDPYGSKYFPRRYGWIHGNICVISPRKHAIFDLRKGDRKWLVKTWPNYHGGKYMVRSC